MYYGNSNTQVATNAQILNLQTQINNINTGINSRVKLGRIRIAQSYTWSKSGLNGTEDIDEYPVLYTLPNNVIFANIGILGCTGNFTATMGDRIYLSSSLNINQYNSILNGQFLNRQGGSNLNISLNNQGYSNQDAVLINMPSAVYALRNTSYPFEKLGTGTPLPSMNQQQIGLHLSFSPNGGVQNGSINLTIPYVLDIYYII